MQEGPLDYLRHSASAGDVQTIAEGIVNNPIRRVNPALLVRLSGRAF
jgi:hypothetical protein